LSTTTILLSPTIIKNAVILVVRKPANNFI
jgi:hypothetical protein